MDINKLKDIQSDVIRKSRTINIILIIMWGLIIYIMYKIGFIFQFFIFATVIIIIIGAIVRHIFLNKQINEFNKGFKDIFVLESLKKIFDNLNYSPDEGIDYNVIAGTKMMNMGDRYSSNDYFEAEYKDVKVRQADVHIEEEHQTTDSDGHTTTTWVTIFKGKWMIFDFNKVFNANVQVSQKGFGNSRISNWGEKTKYKKVQMEDSEFNKLFRIFAQDEHDAFYILTPSLMEKIKKLTNDIKGKILLCFIDNQLHVGLYNNEDSFEYNIYKKINEENIYDNISKDIKIITSFVDQLNLDNSLFRREV